MNLRRAAEDAASVTIIGIGYSTRCTASGCGNLARTIHYARPTAAGGQSSVWNGARRDTREAIERDSKAGLTVRRRSSARHPLRALGGESDSLPSVRFRASVNARLASRSEIVSEPEIAVAVCVLVYQVSATRVDRVSRIRNDVFSVTEVNRNSGATIRRRNVVVNPITLARPHTLTGRPQTAIIRAADVDPRLAVVVCVGAIYLVATRRLQPDPVDSIIASDEVVDVVAVCLAEEDASGAVEIGLKLLDNVVGGVSFGAVFPASYRGETTPQWLPRPFNKGALGAGQQPDPGTRGK